MLEAISPERDRHTIDLVLVAREDGPGVEPRRREQGLIPKFVDVDDLQELRLKPPLAGHLRSLHRRRDLTTAPLLGNLWRSDWMSTTSPGAGLAGD